MNKYGNKKTVVDGITFDSKAEAARYQELRLLEQGGAIRHLQLQPQFMLLPAFRDRSGKVHRAIMYRGDFGYREGTSEQVIIEDVKGAETVEFKLKAKLLLYNFPDIDFRIVRN